MSARRSEACEESAECGDHKSRDTSPLTSRVNQGAMSDSGENSCDTLLSSCNQAESSDQVNEAKEKICDHVVEEEPIKFDPPLYKQRYSAVTHVLRSHDVTSVVDFGIAEANVLLYYKGVQSLRRIVGVDIDEELLMRTQWKALPLTTDFVQPRRNELSIELLCGSVAEYDTRTRGCDAVTMIEVVEHLEEPVLTEMVPNLFGNLRPALVVMTTPNSEYNVLFPGFSGFRHPDHKFEWTRKQFQDWCEGVAEEYAYTVAYSGVGEPPPDAQHVGHCSQIAVFHRNQGNNKDGGSGEQDGDGLQGVEQCEQGSSGMNAGERLPYIQITRQEHPHQDLGVSEDQRILNEASYYINWMGLDYKHALRQGDVECDHWSEENQLEIALEQLLSFRRLADLCPDKNKLRKILVDAGVTFSAEDDNIIIHTIDHTDDDDSEYDSDVTDDENAHSSRDERQESYQANETTENNDQWDDGNSEWESPAVVSSPCEEESWDDVDPPVPVSCVYVGSPGSNTQPQIINPLTGIEPGQFSDAEDDWTPPHMCKTQCDMDDLTEKTDHMSIHLNKFSETHAPCKKTDIGVSTEVSGASCFEGHTSQTFSQQYEDQSTYLKCLTSKHEMGQTRDEIVSNSQHALYLSPAKSACDAHLSQQTAQSLSGNITQGCSETAIGKVKNDVAANHIETQNISSNHGITTIPSENYETPSSQNQNRIETLGTFQQTKGIALSPNLAVANLASHVVRCRGCGCEMTQLGNCGPALCGLTLACRTSFTQRFRTAADLRAGTSLYRATVAGQFGQPD